MMMISSMASPSSATVRVEKATSEFLIGPDWTLNMDICDTVNSNQMLAKDVVKAVKKRLQHKNPKVQLLALTLLETMVKNCGDYVHFQIAERNILPEMVKIVRKKTDMHVRDKILTLIGSWHDAFGAGGRYPQYYMAYEDLRRTGVNFPQRPPDSAPILTPPVTHPISRQPQPGYGMPSSSSTRLDEVMAADQSISLATLNSMQDVLGLLTEMLQAVDPNDRSAIKDEVIIDLVEQCRTNQRKLVQLLATTGDEELLGQGLELNDKLQIVLAKHDSIALGNPVPPNVTNTPPTEPEKKPESSPKSPQASAPINATSNDPPAPPGGKGLNLIDEEDEEEDDFALLARRHLKTRVVPASEAPSSPSMSNALVPISGPTTGPAQTRDKDIIDLLSITLSTDQNFQAPSSRNHNARPENVPSTGPYPGNPGLAYNNYVAPWAQPQPSPSPSPSPSPNFHQPVYSSQPAQFETTQLTTYPPPPWAATPGYFTNQRPYNYSNPRPSFSSNPRPLLNNESKQQFNNSGSGSAAPNVGPKPFVPSYRLFDDLNVFGNNADGRFQSTSNASSGLSGSNSNNHSMVGGKK
ncbi:ENTH/VHS/GAT family protein [Striga hermonthica]|uniref:ENTH/VHS/GAT family protein n=1 Tax=Striga hermonthica TaxID=68872 RepID=A0A9N7RLS4_STRHE|nr:ENTH/VHS/GAT family protein [Striga hermonthica]